MKPVLGIGLVGMGAIMVFGGITGRLAPMLAAIFSPSALTQASSHDAFWPAIGIRPLAPPAETPGIGPVEPPALGPGPIIELPGPLPAIPALPASQPIIVNPFVNPGAQVVTT